MNFRRLLTVAMHHPRTVARSYYDALRETIAPMYAPRLSQDLRRLFASNRTVTVLLSEGDPGGDIIMSQAKLTAARAIRRGQMRMETINGGDHTFSQSRARRALICDAGRAVGVCVLRRFPGRGTSFCAGRHSLAAPDSTASYGRVAVARHFAARTRRHGAVQDAHRACAHRYFAEQDSA